MENLIKNSYQIPFSVDQVNIDNSIASLRFLFIASTMAGVAGSTIFPQLSMEVF